MRTESTPAAKHSEVVGHDTPFRRLVPAGGLCCDQVKPPVVVVIIVDPAPLFPVFPTATQSSEFEHEMPVRSTTSEGAFWSVHVEPVFEVPITYGVELRFVPTAMQVVSMGQSMEFN